ncbi:MAG: 2-oxoglutarate dehydrogenase E1 subunit family protein, partial [Aeromicrobium sp.]
MAESSKEPSTPDFGTNQWLVEEMYDRYQEDPTSVDASWVTFFEDGNVPSDNGGPSGAATTTPQSQPEKKPEPAPAKKAEPVAKAEPKTEPAPKKAEPEPKKDPAPAAKSEPLKPQSEKAKKEADSEPPQPKKKAGDPGTVEKVTMRGAAARTVQNMDTS